MKARSDTDAVLAEPAWPHHPAEPHDTVPGAHSVQQFSASAGAEEDPRIRLERELAVERASRLAAEAERDQLAADFAAALSMRDDFFAAASHDLKTPISALQLQIQGILRNAERLGLDGRLSDRLQAMGRQVRHIHELVERFLDVSRVSSGHLDLVPEEMDLAELVRDVAERLEPDLTWARCPLTLAASEKVVGVWDRTRLEQVITNLVSNAIKYGRGAPIEIRVEAADGAARVSVRDHGAGIAPEQQARIFEKFYRAVAGRGPSGLGLGLWIAKRIIESSGGTIEVESALGVGSTFTVVLPLAPPGR